MNATIIENIVTNALPTDRQAAALNDALRGDTTTPQRAFWSAVGAIQKHQTPAERNDSRILAEAAYNKQFVGDNFAGFKIEFRPETFSYVLISTWDELRDFVRMFPGEVTHVCTRVAG